MSAHSQSVGRPSMRTVTMKTTPHGRDSKHRAPSRNFFTGTNREGSCSRLPALMKTIDQQREIT
jgi:hypothetical protein